MTETVCPSPGSPDQTALPPLRPLVERSSRNLPARRVYSKNERFDIPSASALYVLPNPPTPHSSSRAAASRRSLYSLPPPDLSSTVPPDRLHPAPPLRWSRAAQSTDAKLKLVPTKCILTLAMPGFPLPSALSASSPADTGSKGAERVCSYDAPRRESLSTTRTRLAWGASDSG